MFLLYAGIGLAARSPWVLILALPLVIILRYGVVAREETYLERRFGAILLLPTALLLMRPPSLVRHGNNTRHPADLCEPLLTDVVGPSQQRR